MFDTDWILASKLIALGIFFPMYLGALVFALWGPNRERFAEASLLVLNDERRPDHDA